MPKITAAILPNPAPLAVEAAAAAPASLSPTSSWVTFTLYHAAMEFHSNHCTHTVSFNIKSFLPQTWCGVTCVCVYYQLCSSCASRLVQYINIWPAGGVFTKSVQFGRIFYFSLSSSDFVSLHWTL